MAIADQASSALAWFGSRAVLQRGIAVAERELLKERLATVRRQLRRANPETDRDRIRRTGAEALAFSRSALRQSGDRADLRLCCS